MGALANGLRTARVRRGIAAAAVALAAGGLVLARAPAAARTPGRVEVAPAGSNAASFHGPGAHGTVSLSHTKVLAGGGESLYAEIKMTADPSDGAKERAPLALAVVLDTSGSMEGEKIQRAKDAVLALMRDMRDGDEVALVRYDNDATVEQPLARLGDVRRELEGRVREIRAGGGTNIPAGLQAGLRALEAGWEPGGSDRVRRIVLASDGLDSTRQQAERLASDSAERGITVSSMGIGLDFDEGYMSALARDGHGNFGFVNDGSSLATFLHREMDEAATTTVENATVRVTLPKGVRFVRASGADVRVDGAAVAVRLGALFAGDERRALLELETELDEGDAPSIASSASWHRVGGADAEASVTSLSVVATRDRAAVERGRDGAVLASATSVLASQRELEAAEAYSRGDQARARALVQQNIAALSAAKAAAPAPAAAALERQATAYGSQLDDFAAAPTSAKGKQAAKQAAAKESSNLSRKSY